MAMDDKTRAFIARAKQKFSSGEYDDFYEAAYDIMYEDWKLPENENLGYGQMIEKLDAKYGDLAVLIQLIGAFNYQVCNGGIIQWYDNGYASKKRGRHHADHDLFDELYDGFEDSDLISIKDGPKFGAILDRVQNLFEDLEDIEDCHECEGKRWVKCPDCNGSGTVDIDEDDEDEDADDTCGTCDGNGEVPCDGCNTQGDMDENQHPDFSSLTRFTTDSVDKEYYSFNEGWIASLNGYLMGLSKEIGVRAKARAMGLSESSLRGSSEEYLAKIVKTVEDNTVYFGLWTIPGDKILAISDVPMNGNFVGKKLIRARTWKGVYEKLEKADISRSALAKLELQDIHLD